MAEQVRNSTDTARRDEAWDRALNVIHDLALELHPEWRKTLIVRRDSDLDRDLGYDSLARAELLLRLNRGFKIELCLACQQEKCRQLLFGPHL